MSRSTIVDIKCDGDKCDKHRSQDSNHWLVGAVIDMNIAQSIPTPDTNSDSYISTSHSGIFITTDIKMINALVDVKPEGIKDLCGEECAIKWVSKQLSEIKK